MIYGRNAQGKTNLLEAIYLVATGRSFRSQNLSELICYGESFFFIEAEVVRDGVSHKVQLIFDGEQKKLAWDASVFSSFQPLLGHLPMVLYTPYDIELIMGSPQERRRFLNVHLAQSDPLYVHHLTRFWRAMKQRNCLLRKRHIPSIECWEIEMAQSAEYLTSARQKMIAELSLKELAEENQKLELRLSSLGPYLQLLQKNRAKEMELGFTLAGPHRDDFEISINGKSARNFASEGQKKTALFSLKLAEWQRLSSQIQSQALMGFDDLSASLDLERETLFRPKFRELGQVFVTTPRKPDGEDHFIDLKNVK